MSRSASIGFATLAIDEDRRLSRNDLGRAERIVLALARLAYGSRSLAIISDDQSEVRVLIEAANITHLEVPLEVTFLADDGPQTADVVAYISRPKSQPRQSREGRDVVAKDLLKVVSAVQPNGLVVQLRDDLTVFGVYEGDGEVMQRAVHARNGAR